MVELAICVNLTLVQQFKITSSNIYGPSELLASFKGPSSHVEAREVNGEGSSSRCGCWANLAFTDDEEAFSDSPSQSDLHSTCRRTSIVVVEDGDRKNLFGSFLSDDIRVKVLDKLHVPKRQAKV